MKKWIVGILSLFMVIAISTVGFSQEYFPPPRDNSGIIGGRAGEGWGLGIFNRFTLKEISDPAATPSANTGWLYAMDNGGLTQIYWEDNAGTQTNLISSSATLNSVYINGETITLDANGDIKLSLSVTGRKIEIANTFAGTQAIGLEIDAEVAQLITDALKFSCTAGTITDAIDASHASIVNAINVGANVIIGTNAQIDFTEFDVSATTGSVTINDDGDLGAFTVEGTVLDINSLDFVGAGAITTAASSALTLNVAGGDAAGESLIITSRNITLLATGALTITPDAVLTTAIILTDTDLTNALSVGDNNIIGTTGGFTYTAWSIDASGNFTTTGTLSGATILQDAIAAKSADTTLTLNGKGTGGVSIGTLAGTGTITLGGGGFATLVSLPSTVDLTMAGGELNVTDTAEADLVDLVNNTLVTSNILHISATGTRTSGATILITDGASTASTIAITASTQTSGKGISYTNAGAGILTGDAIYLAVTDGAGFTGSYLNCFDGIASDFTIKRYGATVIAGNASGADALTLTNGDILVTAGNIDITTGNFAIGTGAIALGADPADAGAIRLSNNTFIESEKAVTGTDINIIGVNGSDIILIGSAGASGVTITPNTIISGTLSAGAAGFTVDADGDTVVKTLNGHTFTAGSSIFTGTAGQTYTFPTTSSTLARTDAGQTFTGVNIFTAPTFTTSITPSAAGGSTIGTAALEWGHVYLTDSAVIYAQADQTNTLTSAATGWTANLKFTAPTLVATATGSLTLGTVNSILGQAIFYGSTSGSVTLQPAVAAGTSVITMPARTGQVQLASSASVITPAASATLTVGLSNVYTYAATDNEDVTITASAGGTAGDEITIIFLTAGTGDEIITFHATLMHSTGTLTLGTDATKYYVVRFISNGSAWFEVSRTAVQT